MKPLFASCFLVLAGLFTTQASAQTAQEIVDIKRQIEAITEDQRSLLHRMELLQKRVAEISTGQSPVYEPGLLLEIYAQPATNVDGKRAFTSPAGLEKLGTLPIKHPTPFSHDSFRQAQGIERYFDRISTQRWSGYLHIREPGKYILVNDLRAEPREGWGSCYTFVEANGSRAPAITENHYFGHKTNWVNLFTEVKFEIAEPGYVPFALWRSCEQQGMADFGKIVGRIGLVHPGEVAVKEISSNDLFYVAE